MITVSGPLGQDLISALMKPEGTQRRAAVESWIHLAVKGLQDALHQELSAYAHRLLEASLTPEGWNALVRDAQQNRFQLALKVKLVGAPAQQDTSAADAAKAAGVVSSGAGGDGGGGYSGGGRDAGPSPNDQRSNVMNPNNPAYHESANNRSNQMNPNNPAHWSSRGHARGRS